MMLGKIQYDCPFCEEVHEIEIRREDSETIIKDQQIKYVKKSYYCPVEDDEFAPSDIMEENLFNAKEAYREKMGLLKVHEIKEIRKMYGVTQKEYANLLGVGEVTVQRYEKKTIQDSTYDTIMRLTRDNPNYCLQMLQKNKGNFEENRYREIRNNVICKVKQYGKECFINESIQMQYLDFGEKSKENGYANIDIKKIGNIMNYIACYVEDLYKVKMMKMLWYIDQLAFKKNGHAMTGLVYQHMPYGALPLAHYDLVKLPSIQIEEEEHEDYTTYKILPGKQIDAAELEFEEVCILQEVINKFRDFNTKEIIDYMHEENAYKTTSEKEIISFSEQNIIKDF